MIWIRSIVTIFLAGMVAKEVEGCFFDCSCSEKLESCRDGCYNTMSFGNSQAIRDVVASCLDDCSEDNKSCVDDDDDEGNNQDTDESEYECQKQFAKPDDCNAVISGPTNYKDPEFGQKVDLCVGHDGCNAHADPSCDEFDGASCYKCVEDDDNVCEGHDEDYCESLGCVWTNGKDGKSYLSSSTSVAVFDKMCFVYLGVVIGSMFF